MTLNDTAYVDVAVENVAVPSGPPTSLRIPLDVNKSVSPGVSRSMEARLMSALTLKRRRTSSLPVVMVDIEYQRSNS